MKVLFVNTVAAMGGAEWSLLELAGALRSRGHRIHVACPQGELFARLQSASLAPLSCPSLRLMRPHRPRGWPDWLRLPAVRRRLRRIVAATRPDIVHANSLAAMAACVSVAGGVPLVWHLRDISFPAAAARRAAARAGAVVAISPPVAERLCRCLPPRLRSRVHLIVNGIDLDRFAGLPSSAEARRRLGLPPEAPLAGMAAHFAPWKRHDLFLEAAVVVAAHLPAARFALAGDALFAEQRRHRRRIEERAARLGLGPRLHFAGRLDDCALFLRALDLLVHPADSEPFGRVICEAMAAGTAVLAADAAGPRAIVEENVTGCLAPAGDSEALAAAMLALLRDPVRRRRLAGAARERVAEDFDIRRVACRIEALHASLV